MLNQIKNRLSGLSTRGAIVVAFLAIVAASGVAYLLTRSGTDAQADTTVQPVAARIDRVDGSVAIARTNADAANQQPDWAEATVNTPVSIGDRIYAKDNSHASIAFTGHDSVRLNPEASLDVLALADRRTQLALRSGSATFDVGELASDELYEVATPCGSVDFAQPGLYQVGLDGDNAVISVLNGVARVVGGQGSGEINKGQVFTLACQTSSEAVGSQEAEASQIAPDLAGEIVDDYYRDRYARSYDGRYRNYDTYLADPNFYDPYRTSLSCQYVDADIAGLSDLDYYGDWVNLNDYGNCWAPRVSTGWAPYHSGFWDLDDVWGPTWVASESWGWAPYHYGRWAYVSDRWFWVPEVRTRPAYCPAPVAFFSVGEQIAWVPLGPREVYVPRYYDRNFQPRYLASGDAINVVTRQRSFVNFNAPGAVTVVGVNALRGQIGPGRFTAGDPSVVGKSRVLLDPLSVNGVRQVAMNREDAKRRIKLTRSEQEVFNKSVVAGAKVASAPGRQDLAKALNVQAAPENWKGNKLKINQGGGVTSARRADGLPQPALSSGQRERQMSALATRAQQGDKSARREMRQMMREDQATAKQTAKQTAAQSTVGGQQSQTGQSRQQMKEQRRVERQQQAGSAAQQGASRQAQQQMKPQQEIKQQRKIDRQQQAAGASQQQAARQAQQQQMKQQRRIERQQQVPQQQARPQPKPPKQRPPDVQFQQQRQPAMQQQMKQQRRMERQQQVPQQQARPQPKPPKQRPPDVQFQQQRQAVMQQQAARAQQAQRQTMRPQQPHQGPALGGPPIRQDQPQQRIESSRRKPPK